MSSKILALKPKQAKIGIPTTEIIGETTVNGRKTPVSVLTGFPATPFVRSP
jgi:hypothetical protein